ncbi:hypothetical protein WGT02_16605 [Rhizobium sp. T1470]|uniref:hypothetical protein n=1 Tax=unclassified Rhizobium TaxID=2613769 RepID=UPI001AAF204F|nr:hypothetical protein [Rhizobium sp. T1473]MCA0802807.1 hypothetical protein [Rhizobium sp. T1473]
MEELTRGAVKLCLTDGAYYRLDVTSELSHPDQRISKDIRAFAVTTLSFLLALFRAAAGVAYPGSGRILRPGIRFLPQQPYFPPSTLRQLIVPLAVNAEIPDERISMLLAELRLERISKAEGFRQEVE